MRHNSKLKIVALNIDIKQLLVFDNIVNQLAKQYNLPPYVAAFRLFNDITYYNKIGGLKKEVSRLFQQIFVVNGICANQNKAMMAMINLHHIFIVYWLSKISVTILILSLANSKACFVIRVENVGNYNRR
jgi:hypothetical protein